MPSQTVKKVVSRQLRSTTQEVRGKLFAPRRIVKVLLIIIIVAILVPVIIFFNINNSFQSQIFSTLAPITKVKGAVWFASLADTMVRKEEVAALSEVYKSGKVQKVYLVGDSTAASQLTASGVNAQDIITGGDVDNIHDGCTKIRQLHAVTEAVLVSADYRMLRLMYQCTTAGIQLQGLVVPTPENNSLATKLNDLWQLPSIVLQTVSD